MYGFTKEEREKIKQAYESCMERLGQEEYGKIAAETNRTLEEQRTDLGYLLNIGQIPPPSNKEQLEVALCLANDPFYKLLVEEMIAEPESLPAVNRFDI